MKVHGIIGCLAALAVFILGYLPLETQITVFVFVGASAGIVFAGAHRWAREGLVGAVMGSITGAIVGQMIPSMLATVPQNSALDSLFIVAFPFMLKACFIWASVSGLIHKLQSNSAF